MDFEEHEEELGMGGGASPVEENQQQQPLMMAMRNNTSIKRRYRECLKNHAITIGGHALDGCGEFLPAGPEGSIDALKCAACNCHRNFHRKETTTFITTATPAAGDAFPSFSHLRNQPSPFAACYRTPGGYLHVAGSQRGPPALALPSPTDVGVIVGGVHNAMEDHDGVVVMDHNNGGGGGGGSNSKKRFRTKFSPEQKEKMLAFAEKLGWRMQKQDEGVVQEFCNETGVKRQVLKVWMHNNKHTLEDLHLLMLEVIDVLWVKRRFSDEVGRSWEIWSLNVSEVVHY